MVDFNKRWSNKQVDIACTEKSWFYSDIVIARRDIKIDIPILLAKGIEIVIIVSLPVEQISGYDESVYVLLRRSAMIFSRALYLSGVSSFDFKCRSAVIPIFIIF